MRFSALFLAALPLLSGAFAAPAPKSHDLAVPEARSVEILNVERCGGGCSGEPINGVDGLVAIFTDIKAELDAHVKAKISVKAEASAALDLIVNKCNSAVAAISADVELKANVAACTSAQKQLVAKAIADVIVNVNAVFVSLDAALLADAEIKAKVSSCNDITAKLFLGVEACISGVIQLALNICASLKVKIAPIFVCITTSLKASLGGSLSLKGLVGLKGLFGVGLH